MERLFSHPNRRRMVVGAFLSGVALVVYGVCFFFFSDSEKQRSAAIVEYAICNVLMADGKPVLYFAEIADSTFAPAANTPDSLLHHPRYAAGVWVNRYAGVPSCHGRLAAVLPDTLHCNHWQPGAFKAVAARTYNRLVRQRAQLKAQLSEAAYYLKVHSVQDEGYTDVARYRLARQRTLQQVEQALGHLTTAKAAKRLSIRHEVRYAALFDGRRLPLMLLATTSYNHIHLLQTVDQTTPARAKAVSALPWQAGGTGLLAAGYAAVSLRGAASTADTAVIVPTTVGADGTHNLPSLLATDGAPIFTPYGRFVGLVSGRHIIVRNRLLLKKNR